VHAVCPAIMPKHISEVFMKPRINKNNGNSYPRANRFLVSYHLIRVGYAYGHTTGYSRENAFMEASRLLRYLLARDIQSLDIAMGVNVELDQLFDFIDFDNDDIDDDFSDDVIANEHNEPPTITTTITNQPSRLIIYDDQDNIEFVFDESETHIDDDMPEINFDDIDVIEI
jgi:hypothetical protein